LPLHIYKDPRGLGTIDGATLKTDRSMRCETLLLVGDMRDTVVVTSAIFLREFLLALRKRFVVKGWILCRTGLYWMNLALSLCHWIRRLLLGPRSAR
jgi:hypothetical protein